MSVFNDGDRNDIIHEFRKQEYQDREAEKGKNRESDSLIRKVEYFLLFLF